MSISRYPLEGENFCRVACEHAVNQVNDRLCGGSLEASARETLLAVAVTAQLWGTRLLHARFAGTVINGGSKTFYKVEVSSALRAVENA